MYSRVTRFAFSFAPILTALVAADPFCGSGAYPNPDNCHNAVAKIDSNADYPTGTQFDAGDCTVALEINLAGGQSHGSNIIDMANAIIDGPCEANGWNYDGNNNVSVSQCTVCSRGVCAVCNAPSKRVPTKTSQRLSLASLEERQSPPSGVTCGSAFGSATVDDCNSLADSVGSMTSISLPFTTSGGSCDLAVEGHEAGATASGSDVSNILKTDTAACDTDGLVGRTVDETRSDYTVWFGVLCGEFGFGTGNCQP